MESSENFSFEGQTLEAMENKTSMENISESSTMASPVHSEEMSVQVQMCVSEQLREQADLQKSDEASDRPEEEQIDLKEQKEKGDEQVDGNQHVDEIQVIDAEKKEIEKEKTTYEGMVIEAEGKVGEAASMKQGATEITASSTEAGVSESEMLDEIIDSIVEKVGVDATVTSMESQCETALEPQSQTAVAEPQLEAVPDLIANHDLRTETINEDHLSNPVDITERDYFPADNHPEAGNTGGSDEKELTSEHIENPTGPVSGTGESGNCIPPATIEPEEPSKSPEKPAQVQKPTTMEEAQKPASTTEVKSEMSSVTTTETMRKSNSTETDGGYTSTTARLSASSNLSRDMNTNMHTPSMQSTVPTMKKPNVGESGGIGSLGPKANRSAVAGEVAGGGGLGLENEPSNARSTGTLAAGGGGLGLGNDGPGTAPAPPAEKRAYFSATMANPDGSLMLPMSLPPEPLDLAGKKTAEGRCNNSGSTAIVSKENNPLSLKSTVDDPRVLVSEQRDLPPFDPAFAEQYMIFSQQYNAYAHQFALYAQYCVHQGAVETARKQHEEQQKQRAAALAKAQKKAAKKGKPLPQPVEGGQAARQIMITPYRHNWILSGNSEEHPTTWWEHLRNEFVRLTGVTGCEGRSCGCGMF